MTEQSIISRLESKLEEAKAWSDKWESLSDVQQKAIESMANRLAAADAFASSYSRGADTEETQAAHAAYMKCKE